MGAQGETRRKARRRRRQADGGHGAAGAAGQGRARKRGDAKPRGLRPADPLAKDLVAAVASTQGKNGNGANGITKAQARKVAVDFGGAMLETASIETARHSDDVEVVVRALCGQLGIKDTARQDVLAAARLHDIGKMAIPAEVLSKNGPLSESEWALMREHTVIGEQILSSVSSLEGIARLVRHSHERWDGNGYPDGLAGEDIPLGSRIIFCADAFDAIRCDRPYRAGKTAADSLAEVRRCAGTQFDPTVVEAFVEVVRQLRLAPRANGFRRSSRLTALLLMLAIGTTGSAIARSGLVGEPASGVEPPANSTVTSAAAMLGLSLDKVFSGNPADTPRIRGAALSGAAGNTAQGAEGGAGVPADQGTEQDQAPAEQSGSGDAGSSGGNAGRAPDHPHGGPPGQTGNHPQGGPPGQTGNHPQGGAPGQSGSHPQGGPPGESGNQPAGGPPSQADGGLPKQSGSGSPAQSKKPK